MDKHSQLSFITHTHTHTHALIGNCVTDKTLLIHADETLSAVTMVT